MKVRIKRHYRKNNGEWRYIVERRYFYFLWLVFGNENWQSSDMSLSEAESFVQELQQRNKVVRTLNIIKQK